jgi:nicotinic acid mononucleotide adenylyltransferase
MPFSEYTVTQSNTTLTISSSTGALLEAGRVIPASHPRATDAATAAADAATAAADATTAAVDAAIFAAARNTIKTPAGVSRVPQPSLRVEGAKTSDIISKQNLSQGACLEKFGYAPGEIVNKLCHEHVINEQEDRVIRYLLARDDRNLLENLIYIENNGITKASIERFRRHLDVHLGAVIKSPVARRRSESGQNFFGEPNISDNGDSNNSASFEENKAPERPNTALPAKEDGDPEETKAPFQIVLHKVLAKIALRLKELGPNNTRQKVILVGSGTYNPLHRLHLRMFYLARQFLEGHSHFEVLGGIVSPSHPTAVRQKFRQKPKEIIPPKHRLAMARAAVGDSAWLTVDPWEITRRRVLDYTSVLDHVREIVSVAFPEENIKLIMLCDGNELPKLSTEALTKRNCHCLCICRPMQVDILLRQITSEWKNVAYVLEDTAILANDLERISSTTVRKDAMEGKDIAKSVGMKVGSYMKRFKLADKMAGRERWNKEDKEFDFEGEDETDRPYLQMPQSEMGGGRNREEELQLMQQSGIVRHKEDFSLLF